jgi:hypothetical protein
MSIEEIDKLINLALVVATILVPAVSTVAFKLKIAKDQLIEVIKSDEKPNQSFHVQALEEGLHIAAGYIKRLDNGK